MRVAVAVSDDEKFTEHFGRAQKFLIYEFDGDKVELIDRRESKKVPGEKHQWSKSLKIVEDSDVVICHQIGMTAKPGLKSEGKKLLKMKGLLKKF
ncbi:MAG: NifB/NifX family molybdenum-iron cluster-binding protein [Methanobacterium sp. ERen5]|nr:MAG: NifB/NifX family molybdenum-iron cluster-binding protein [Methanobacterium sp. ERen5]